MNRFAHSAPTAILTAAALWIAWWFRVYFTSDNIASVDLPSHFVLAEGLRARLLEGRFTYYEPSVFTGFPAFQFYGFLPSLITALLSYPLGALSQDPIVLATHLILVIGVSLLPFSFYFAATPLAEEILGKLRYPDHRSLVATLTALFSFWFINHDRQWFGIGAAAPMNIGLFAQLPGWHIFLLYIGVACRFRLRSRQTLSPLLAVLYALLPLTHMLTWIYVTVLGAFLILIFTDQRRPLLLSHLLGLALAAFWFVPALALLGEYTAYDVFRPKGDFLEILFRYPLTGILRSLGSWSEGRFSPLSPIECALPFLTLVLLAHPRIQKHGLTFSLFLFVILTILLFSSGFVASSLPFGIHYYRFIGYQFLLCSILFSVAPLVWVRESGRISVIPGALFMLAIASFLQIVRLPHDERDTIHENRGVQYLADERNVIQEIRERGPGRRVFVEFHKDYKIFPPLSAHYISAQLTREAGVEAIVNSHLQESLAYRMIVATAHLLGAKTYNVPLLFAEHARLSPDSLIAQLREFGITDIVSGREEFSDQLEKALGTPPKRIGRYRLFTLAEGPFAPIEPTTKSLICYIDTRGSMPFYLVQYYFYARQDLYSKFQLLDCSFPNRAPPALPLLINVGKKESASPLTPDPHRHVVTLHFDPRYLLNHYAVHLPKNVELEKYRDIEFYLDVHLKVESLLTVAPPSPDARELEPQPRFSWSGSGQGFSIDGLIPGGWYRINYSYFPYWGVEGGEMYRGSGERMYLRATSSSVTGTYSRWRHLHTWLGGVITLGGIAALLFVRKRNRMSNTSRSVDRNAHGTMGT